MKSAMGQVWSVTGLCLPAIALAAGQAQANEPRYPFDIKEQSLPEAINRFGLAANVQVIFSPALANGKTSHAVQGRLSRDEAIRGLLRGTGLSYRFTPENVLLVFAPTPVPSAQPIARGDAVADAARQQ